MSANQSILKKKGIFGTIGRTIFNKDPILQVIEYSFDFVLYVLYIGAAKFDIHEKCAEKEQIYVTFENKRSLKKIYFRNY